MRNTKIVLALVLVSAGVVMAIGVPWLLNRHRAPAYYEAGKVATTEDIQEFDMMWSDLESLQEQSAQLDPRQYKQKFLERTIAYLRLDPEQTKTFEAVVDQSLERLNLAKDQLAAANKQTIQVKGEANHSPRESWSGEEPASIAARRDAWSRWSDDQRESSDLLLSALQSTPRHDLLAERRLLWLLKLDFGLPNTPDHL